MSPTLFYQSVDVPGSLVQWGCRTPKGIVAGISGVQNPDVMGHDLSESSHKGGDTNGKEEDGRYHFTRGWDNHFGAVIGPRFDRNWTRTWFWVDSNRGDDRGSNCDYRRRGFDVQKIAFAREGDIHFTAHNRHYRK
jgi:hypothetical protein